MNLKSYITMLLAVYVFDGDSIGLFARSCGNTSVRLANRGPAFVAITAAYNVVGDSVIFVILYVLLTYQTGTNTQDKYVNIL